MQALMDCRHKMNMQVILELRLEHPAEHTTDSWQSADNIWISKPESCCSKSQGRLCLCAAKQTVVRHLEIFSRVPDDNIMSKN